MQKREIRFSALGGIYEQDDLEAVVKIVKEAGEPGGGFFPLPEENIFQEMLAKHEGARKAVAVNSCGTALDVCMMALGVKEGDEVITTPLTFVCTAGTVVARGAKVVFADIDPKTLNLNPDKVMERITTSTKAIIPVHFAGLSVDIDAFDRISEKYGIPIIYDAAHAVGARYRGQPIGGRGKAACYSFQSNKNITCLGEGGAVTTDDPEFAEKVRQLKTFGYVYGKELKVASIGFNYRMTKVQLAAGITQLGKLDKIIARRQELMVRMNKLLQDVVGIILPAGHGKEHGSHLYTIRVDHDKAPFTRAEFRIRLKNECGIETAVHYPAVWSWDAFQKLGYTDIGCPIAKKVCSEIVSLPIFPYTTEEDLEYMAQCILRIIKNG